MEKQKRLTASLLQYFRVFCKSEICLIVVSLVVLFLRSRHFHECASNVLEKHVSPFSTPIL